MRCDSLTLNMTPVSVPSDAPWVGTVMAQVVRMCSSCATIHRRRRFAVVA